MSRISREKIPLNSENVREFFEKRGDSIDPAHELTSILYQDNNPELAERRDKLEKNTIKPLLVIRPDDVVLDIGCGIGRWAEALAAGILEYHGIDFSENLIAYAAQRFADRPNVSFRVMAAQDASVEQLPALGGRVSLVIISGVLIYLNDDQCLQTLANVADLCAESARVYIREPVAIENRLTLREFYSEELKANYNAIYRTQDELWEMFQPTLVDRCFRCVTNEDMYPEEMNNRRETRQRFYIFSR